MQVKLLHRGKRLQRSSKCQLSECRRWKVWRLQRTELLRIFSPNALALQLQLPARQVRSARWFKCLKSQPVDLTKGHIFPHCFTHFLIWGNTHYLSRWHRAFGFVTQKVERGLGSTWIGYGWWCWPWVFSKEIKEWGASHTRKVHLTALHLSLSESIVWQIRS